MIFKFINISYNFFKISNNLFYNLIYKKLKNIVDIIKLDLFLNNLFF